MKTLMHEERIRWSVPPEASLWLGRQPKRKVRLRWVMLTEGDSVSITDANLGKSVSLPAPSARRADYLHWGAEGAPVLFAGQPLGVELHNRAAEPAQAELAIHFEVFPDDE